MSSIVLFSALLDAFRKYSKFPRKTAEVATRNPSTRTRGTELLSDAIRYSGMRDVKGSYVQYFDFDCRHRGDVSLLSIVSRLIKSRVVLQSTENYDIICLS